jgi:hypothetical protein
MTTGGAILFPRTKSAQQREYPERAAVFPFMKAV